MRSRYTTLLRLAAYAVILASVAALTSTQHTFAGDKNSKEGLKWLSLDNATAAAAKEKKPILLDVYTDWCKWCKKLDSDTYGDPTVSAYLNKKFIIAKLNPEEPGSVTYDGKKLSNEDFARSMGIRGYPTLLFLGADGKVINGLSSYVDAKQFLTIAKYFGEKKNETMTWEEYSKTAKD